MSLYLVQHGKCEPENINPDRPLTEEGKNDVKRIAGVAKGYHVPVRSIVHSGKTRARETAEIFRGFLSPSGDFSDMPGLNPNDDVKIFAESVQERDGLMIVGHLPFMNKLASCLVTGSPDVPVIKFQQGGIVCLDRDAHTGRWIIKWTLMPHID